MPCRVILSLSSAIPFRRRREGRERINQVVAIVIVRGPANCNGGAVFRGLDGWLEPHRM